MFQQGEAERSSSKIRHDRDGNINPAAYASSLRSAFESIEFLPGLGVGRAGGGELFVEAFVRIDFRAEDSPLHDAEV